MNRAPIALAVLVAMPAYAARPLSLDEALGAASQTNPAIVAAQLRRDQTADDITAALGGFDPNLTFSGGWNRDRNTSVRQEFQTLFLTDSESWNLNMNISATAPTGTSGTLTTSLARTSSRTRFEALGDAAFDPSLIFSEEEARFTIPNFRLSLRQELLRGVKLSYNLQAVRRARESRTLAELEVDKAGQQALKDVAAAYWNWVYLDRLAQIAAQSEAVADENLRVGGARVDAGEAAPVERTRLEAAVVQARSARIEADHTAAQAADALLILMGERPGQEMQPASDPGRPPQLDLDPDKAVDVALAQSFEVQAQRQRVEAAEAALRDARHTVWPSLTANVDAGYSGAIPTGGDTDVAFGDVVVPSVSVGGTLSVPLGNRAAVGARRRAETEWRLQQQTLTQLTSQVRADVEQQVRVLRAAATKVELADVNLRLARETLAAEEALYDAGRTLLKDVLESRTQVDRAEGEAFKARTDYRVAEVELLRLQGGLEGR